MAIDENGRRPRRRKPVAVDDGMAARLRDLDMLHAARPQVGGDPGCRSAAITRVLRQGRDAGDSEELVERGEAVGLMRREVSLEIAVLVGHRPGAGPQAGFGAGAATGFGSGASFGVPP